jgi:hypothetical protein
MKNSKAYLLFVMIFVAAVTFLLAAFYEASLDYATWNREIRQYVVIAWSIEVIFTAAGLLMPKHDSYS